MRTRFVAVGLLCRCAAKEKRSAVPESMEEGELVDLVCREDTGEERGGEGEMRGEGVEVD